MRRWKALTAATVSVVGLGGCGGADEATEDAAVAEIQEIVLGPADGHDLPPTDTGRVAVATIAPDFSAVSLAGPTVTLSQFRGDKNVVLVFYRGHW